MQLAQAQIYYYGYWVYDPVADYYYWFPADAVIVDTTWIDYVPSKPATSVRRSWPLNTSSPLKSADLVETVSEPDNHA